MTTTDEVIVDSSVIIAFVTLEEHSDWASQKMGEHSFFHILDLNYYEVANGLRYKTSDKFTIKDAKMAWLKATKLMSLFAQHNLSEIIDDAFVVASNLNTSVYDAAFLSLAEKLNMSFLTLDEKLAKKLENTKYYRLLKSPNK